MVDCERVRRKDLIQQQNRKFDREIQFLLQANQSSSSAKKRGQHHEYKMTPISEHEFTQFLDSDDTLPASFRAAYETMDEFNDIDAINQRDLLRFVKSVAVQEISRKEDLPLEIQPLLELRPVIEKCEAYHRQMREIAHGLESDDELSRQNATEHLSR